MTQVGPVPSPPQLLEAIESGQDVEAPDPVQLLSGQYDTALVSRSVPAIEHPVPPHNPLIPRL